MGFAAWLLEFLSPMSSASGRAAGPSVCAHLYSYWDCEDAVPTEPLEWANQEASADAFPGGTKSPLS
jgi:hypothetical protein